jgi:hypothetical protein
MPNGRNHLEPPSYCYYDWLSVRGFPLLFHPARSLICPCGFLSRRTPFCLPACLLLHLAESVVPRSCGSAVPLAGSCFHHETDKGAFYLSLDLTNIHSPFRESQVFLHFNSHILLTRVINNLLITFYFITYWLTG